MCHSNVMNQFLPVYISHAFALTWIAIFFLVSCNDEKINIDAEYLQALHLKWIKTGIQLRQICINTAASIKTICAIIFKMCLKQQKAAFKKKKKIHVKSSDTNFISKCNSWKAQKVQKVFLTPYSYNLKLFTTMNLVIEHEDLLALRSFFLFFNPVKN